MMRPSADLGRVYLCRQAVDFHKGMRSLAALFEQSLGLVPFAEKKEQIQRQQGGTVVLIACFHDGTVSRMQTQPAGGLRCPGGAFCKKKPAGRGQYRRNALR